MRLLRLEVEDFKQFTGPGHVWEFHPQGNLITGPNEAGKSTIFLAITRALFDNSSSGAAWRKELVPNTLPSADPKVTLDFIHQGRTLRIHKRFATKGESRLYEQTDDASDWQELARHAEADEQLSTLLGSEPQGRSKEIQVSKWAAFGWLFMPQHLRDLPSGPEATRHVGLDQAGVTLGFQLVRDRTQNEWDKFHTPSGKDTKTGSPLQDAREDLAAIDAALNKLDGDLRQLDTQQATHDDLVAGLPELDRQVGAARDDWNAAQRDTIDLSSAEAARDAARATLEKHESEAARAHQIADERSALESQLTAVDAALTTAVDARAEARAARKRASSDLDAQRIQLTQLDKTLTALRHQLTAASTTQDLRRSRRDLEQATAIQARAADLDEQITSTRADLAALDPVPTPDDVQRATDLQAQITAHRGSQSAASLQVTVDGDFPNLEISLDGTPLADDAVDGSALKEVRVATPDGSGSITITGDTDAAQRFAAEAEEAERELTALLQRYQLFDLAALRARLERATTLSQDLATAEQRRQDLDTRTASELQDEIARLDASAKHLAERLSAADETSDALDALTDDALAAQVDKLRGDVESTAVTQQATQKARDDAQAAYEDAARALSAADQTHAADASRAQTARTARDAHADAHGSTDACAAATRAADRTLADAKAANQTKQTDLDRLQATNTERLDTARQSFERLQKKHQRQQLEVDQLARALEDASAAGPYSRQADLEHRRTARQADITRLERRARALDLLRATMDAARSEVVETVVAPIRSALDRMLAYVTNGRYREADLDESLTPQRLEGDTATDFVQGSEGLKELVATLLRLCVATKLAEDEPQVLVLDDPCVHVHKARTQRLVEILNQHLRAEATGLQVLILTHRPEEFAGLSGTETEAASRAQRS